MKKKNIQELFNGEYTEMNGVEVLNNFPNTYGLEFSEQDLEDYANNTNDIITNGLVKPNIKISHSDQQLILKELFNMADADIWEEIPNLGLLENFRRDGNKILADIKQVPKSMKDIVFSGKLFTSLSPELVKNWRGTGKNIIRAVALTNIPSMKHVLDVPMSQGLSYRGNFVYEEGGFDMSGAGIPKELEGALDEKLTKNNEGLITKFSEMIKDAFSKKSPVVDDKGREKTITMSELQAMQAEMQKGFEGQLNDLKLQLVGKEKSLTMLSEDVKKQKLESKKAQADAICKQASMEGVPPYVIGLFKPILMSEAGEQVVHMSEQVTNDKGDKVMVEVDKPIMSIIQDLFTNYPNKVQLSEMTKTYLSAPSDDENKRINERAKELMSQGFSSHEALMRAGSEVRR